MLDNNMPYDIFCGIMRGCFNRALVQYERAWNLRQGKQVHRYIDQWLESNIAVLAVAIWEYDLQNEVSMDFLGQALGQNVLRGANKFLKKYKRKYTSWR